MRRKSWPEMSKMTRRNLLKMAAGAALISESIRQDLWSVLDGRALGSPAPDTLPTYFLEINLRDQWDFGHFMVPPGLATASSLIRGSSGRKAALYYAPGELQAFPNNIYLTSDSIALAPHVDTVAMLELCELSMGVIHGHEAANATRSPGRSYSEGSGRLPMWLGDPHSKVGGNEHHYSSTPTPATLHNFYQRSLTPELHNGLAFKGVGRSLHTVYHFPAALVGGDLDRFHSRDSLRNAVLSSTGNVVGSVNEAKILTDILNRLDRRYLDRRSFIDSAKAKHKAALQSLGPQLFRAGRGDPVDISLTEAEQAYWSAGVPVQRSEVVKAELWEQAAYAVKLFSADIVRSIALEYDMIDIHDIRTEDQMRCMGKQIALPLARIIESLKTAGIYDRTLIAVYSTDGGRSPAAGSVGTEGRNGVVLAGGMVRGGYYGDVRTSGPEDDGNRYTFHRPDENGIPISNGTSGPDLRVSGADAWMTVMTAAGVPANLCRSFPDTASAKVLSYLLRSS